MGVYIKGLQMPKDCEACPFWEGLVNGCPITHYFTIRRKGVDRPEWCPLIPVPDHPADGEIDKWWERNETVNAERSESDE